MFEELKIIVSSKVLLHQKPGLLQSDFTPSIFRNVVYIFDILNDVKLVVSGLLS